ncbi:hypothetical protein C8R44DRAFT_849600 [Mycena epipterygia]|nr:hypothetical protein C8R44DRAFT_849600 [Mycena epipterygia]
METKVSNERNSGHRFAGGVLMIWQSFCEIAGVRQGVGSKIQELERVSFRTARIGRFRKVRLEGGEWQLVRVEDEPVYVGGIGLRCTAVIWNDLCRHVLARVPLGLCAAVAAAAGTVLLMEGHAASPISFTGSTNFPRFTKMKPRGRLEAAAWWDEQPNEEYTEVVPQLMQPIHYAEHGQVIYWWNMRTKGGREA